MTDTNQTLELFNRFNMSGVEPDRGENVKSYDWPVNGESNVKVTDMIITAHSAEKPFFYGAKGSTIPGMSVQFKYEMMSGGASYDSPGKQLPAGHAFYGERFRFPLDETTASLSDGQKKNISITKERLAGVVRTGLNRNPARLGGDLAALMGRIKGGTPLFISLKTQCKPSNDPQYTDRNEWWTDALAIQV